MRSEPASWTDARLAGTRFHDVRWFERIDSTNKYLLDCAARGEPDGVVAVADEQSAGRGRLGRSWIAPPGSALEGLRRKLHRSDPWIADDDAFADAVDEVADDLVDGLLATPFDGSIASERALSSFTNRWIGHLRASVVPAPPDVAAPRADRR